MGSWDLTTLALPATSMTVASVAVFFLLLVLLAGSSAFRVLLRIPIDPAVPALLALGLALLVAAGTSSRPGKPLSRFWVWGLAAISAVVAASRYPAELADEPLIHALAVAALGGALTLMPRLLSVRPGDRKVRYAAPLSLLVALLLLFPPAFAMGARAVRESEADLDEEIARLRSLDDQLRALLGHDWQSLERDRQESVRRLETFRALSLYSLRRADARFWEAAAVLGRDDELVEVWSRLIDRVVDGLGPARAPTLAALEEEPVRYGWLDGSWVPQPGFAELGEVVEGYHWHLGRLFQELKVPEPAGPESADLARLDEHYRQASAMIGARLAEVAQSWSSHWRAWAMPKHEEWLGEPRPSLGDLFRMRLKGAPHPIALGDLGRLMKLTLSDVTELKEKAACYSREAPAAVQVSCYSYRRAAPTAAGVELLGEVHFLFPAHAPWPREQPTPLEIRLMVHVHGGEDPGKMAGRVMEALYETSRSSGAAVSLTGGVVAAGFRSRSFAVAAPRVRETPWGRQVVEVGVRRIPQ